MATSSSFRFTPDDLVLLQRIREATGITTNANIVRNALRAYEEKLSNGPGSEAWVRKIAREEIVRERQRVTARFRKGREARKKKPVRRRATIASK